MKTPPKTAKRGQRQDKHQRWCPPKPLVGLQPIERMLLRHTFVVCPESRLAVAVIVRAIGDCLSRDLHRERREARRFILGDEVIHWCDWVGLNPDFVRLVARKAGYLADETSQKWLHWLQEAGIEMHQIHTSGHASPSDLQRFARALNPARLVPIHSFSPEKYPQQFDNVQFRQDGEWWDV